MNFNWPLFDGAHVLVRPHRMSIDELQNGYYYFLKEAYSLTGITKRFRRAQVGVRNFPLHFVQNYLVSRYSMNKTAYAINVPLKKQRRHAEKMPKVGPVPEVISQFPHTS